MFLFLLYIYDVIISITKSYSDLSVIYLCNVAKCVSSRFAEWMRYLLGIDRYRDWKQLNLFNNLFILVTFSMEQ